VRVCGHVYGFVRIRVCAASWISSFSKSPKTASRLPRSRPRNRRATKCSHCTLRRCDLRSRALPCTRSLRCAAIRYTLDASTSVLAFDDSDASLLGTGSSASVYRGNLNGQPVAVKVSLSRNAPRCLAGGARLASARRAERVATLSTGSAGGPCRYGVRVLKGYSRGTQGILKGCSEGAQGYSGGTQGYSRGTICFGVQAFRLQGLSQSARAKAPCLALHARRSANVVGSGTTGACVLVRYSATCSASSCS
jgi:hypothetical protein